MLHTADAWTVDASDSTKLAFVVFDLASIHGAPGTMANAFFHFGQGSMRHCAHWWIEVAIVPDTTWQMNMQNRYVPPASEVVGTLAHTDTRCMKGPWVCRCDPLAQVDVTSHVRSALNSTNKLGLRFRFLRRRGSVGGFDVAFPTVAEGIVLELRGLHGGRVTPEPDLGGSTTPVPDPVVDPCNQIACARQCLDECGWDSAQHACVENGNTSTAEVEANLCRAEGSSEQDEPVWVTQFVVLGVTAVLLLLMQVSAAVYRPEEQKIPLVVEIITYFSMLDIVTDITYVSTEPFFSSQLKSAAVAFCAMP